MTDAHHDLDSTARIPTLHPGEPFFIIRAQDALSARTVRAWASLAYTMGVDSAVVEQALRRADAMEAWWGPKKLPDIDHLQDHEAKQLRYEFGRRAWKASIDVEADMVTMLAERRGYDAAMAKARRNGR